MQATPEADTILLTTKLAPPQGGKRWVVRARLSERLGVPPQARLALVHAGVGFGKTACLAQWHHALSLASIPTAWLSVDADDNTLPQFIAYLAAAINRVCPEIGTDVIDLSTRSGSMIKPDALRAPLLNAIHALETPLVLIVDDYHLVETAEINAWVGELVAHAPPNFHLVLASRVLPSLRLARLRAAGEVIEIDAAELALSLPEVRDFIKTVGAADVAGQDIAAAYAQTEGWVGGLQMIAISLRNRRSVGKSLGKTLAAFSGDARAVSDYLRDEVLGLLPPELSEFLLRISILERFSPDLCGAVSGRDDAAELLAQAVSRGLFVMPLDDKGCWHRFHQMFADFLQAQLTATHGADVAALHARACDWFVAQALWHEAVRHATLSGDDRRALEIADSCALNLVRDGDYLALQALISRLPPAQLRLGPHLRLAEAWVMTLSGRIAEVERTLAEMSTQTDAEDYADEMLIIRGTLGYALDDSDRIEQTFAHWSGQPRTQNPWVADVLKSTASASLIWRGRFAAARDFVPCSTPFNRVFQLTLFGWSWMCEGKPAEAEHDWLQAVDLADSEFGARSVAAMLPRVPLARMAYERGDFDTVEMLLASRLSMLEQVGTTDFVNQGTYALGWCRYASGDRGSAIELNERVRLIAMERGLMRLEAHTSLELMRICWRTQPDRLAHIAERLHAIVMAPPTGRVRSTRWLGTRLASLGVAFQRAMATVGSDALSSLDAVVHDIVDVAHGVHIVNVWLMLLIAANHAGNRELTRKALLAALCGAQKFGVLRSFVDTGDWVLPLLKEMVKSGEAASAGVEHTYLKSLITAFAPGTTTQETTAAKPTDSPQLIEPLSKREQDILILVERGLSNKLIGRTLNIGPETVKWHLKNLFGKLGAANRLQAVNQARALSLLHAAN